MGPARSGRWNGDVGGTDDAVDYFAFSLSASKLVGAGLSRLDNDADIFLEDSSGTVLASSRNPAIRREWLNVVLAAGSYHIRVEPQTQYRAEYTLTMGTARPDSAAAGFDTTAVVGVGSQLQERIGPYWDIDWVRVELVANHVYVLEVRGQDSQSGTLVDPELLGVHVDPADSSVFDAYRAGGRALSGGRICDSGMPDEDLAGFPDPPDPARDRMDGLNAYDLDDGAGQDAWLLIRAEATGSHYIEIDSQGGFAGSYTVAAAEAGPFTPAASGRGSCPHENLVAVSGDDDTAVTVTGDDDDTADLVVNRSSIEINEGGGGTFTVRLATQPTQQVSVSVSSGDSGAVSVPSQPLTFTTQNWRTAQPVTVSGVSDDDAGDETVTVTVSASGGDYAGNTATVTVTVDDDDTTDLVVNRGSLTVDEDGGGGTFTVRLATQPTQQVSVSVSSADSGAVSVPSQPLTFTTQNWRTAQTVRVSGVSDDDAGDETVTVTVSASGGDYAGNTATVTVTVDDDDTTDLVVNRGSLTVDEDGDGTFTVRLATQPTQQVSVSVSSADSGAVSVPSQPLTFTTQNWRTAQTVRVSGVSDDDAGDETVTVTVSASGGDYAGNTATVTVTVDDDDTTDLVVNRGSLTVDEDGDGTFTVRLATQPTQQVSVSVSSGDSGAVSVPSQPLTFTTQNWRTAQTVRVSGVSDDDAGDETVTVTVSASGGDYAGNTATVTVTVTDDDTTDLVVNRGSLTVDEGDGGGGTFTVRLATQPTQQVSVSVSSGDSGAVSVPSQPLTFTTQNWRIAQTVRVSGVSDDDAGDETVTVTVSASGGDYAGNTATVTVTVTDDDTTDLVVNRGSLTVDEDDDGTFTVRLATRPTQQVSVSVSSADSGAVSVPSQPLTFTTQNWRTAQTVTVSGVSDDDTGDETVTVTVTASGGDYAGNTATVTVTVTDDDTTDLVVNRGSLTVDEDDDGTFTVRLATQPTQQVSVSVSSGDSGAVSVPSQPLTFTTQNWRTAQTVTVSGVSDDDAGDETVTVTVTASGGDYAGNTATVTVTVDDDDTTDLVVNRGSLTVDEDGGDGTFTVRLATRPTQQVSVSVSSADSGAVSVPSQPLTFTTQNWRTAQTVTVSGVSDDDAGDETVTVTVSASGGDYAGNTATVTVTVDDDDTTDLVVNRGSLTVDEDDDGTFTVRLATRPTQQVSVSVSSGDSGAVSVLSQPLTFTTQNWGTAQTVRVSGVSDDDAGDETVTVTVSASGGDYAGNTATVTVTVTDDDTTDLVVNRGSLTVDEDGDGTFTVRLATRPTQQVSVSVSSGDSGAVSVPSQPLTFTTQNWRTAQTVRVSGVSDDDAGDETVTVTVSASGGDYAGNTATVTVTVTDDDDTTDLVVNRGSLTVDEDGDGTFTVRLATQPTQQVSVSVSSGDSGAVSVPSQPLTFTTQNWRIAQPVTVSGVSDDDTGDETVTVTVTASGGDYAGNTATVTVTVDDDDTTDLVVNRGSLTVDEDGDGTFTVRLATQPTQQVSVSVSSGDSGAVSVPSQPLTFTTQNWRTAQPVTVSGVSDDDTGDETVTVTVTASGGDYAGNTATVTVTVTDDDTTDLVVNRGSLTVDEDGDGTFTVRLATQPTQQVSVTVSSGDSGAVSVPSQPLTFTTQNWRTAQPVTVSGVSDDDAGDETVTVTLTASGGDYAGNTATVTVTVTDDDTTDLVVNRGSLTVDEDDDGTFTVRLATQPTQQVSVTVSSADSGAVSVPSQPLTFTTQNWRTAQPVTVSGVSDDDAGDETVTVTLTASGGDYAGNTATVTVTVTDDDTTDLVVNRSSIEINEGGDGTFTVRLATRPTQQVSVSVSSGDSGAVSVPSQPLTFTTQNWRTAQPVTVSGVSDDDAGDETVTVTVSASGGDYAGNTATVTVTVDDDDTTDLVVNRGSLTVDEGGGGTFTVRLATRPTQQVSVSVSSGDSGAVSVPSQPLTFTTQNWRIAQTVTVSGVSDDDAGDETVTVTVSASGGDYAGENATVTVTVTDDDTTDLVVNRGSLTVDEGDGGGGTFTVRLATRPTQQVSVSVSSGDSGAVSVPSQPLTFTTQNWRTAQTVTVSGVSDDDAGDETVTVTVTASGGDYAGENATVTVTVNDDDTTDLVVNRGSLTVDEDGGDGTFTVRLATRPTQQVSVSVSSGDSGAVSVPSQPLTFTTQNWRIAQPVTVSGVSDDDAGDETVTVTVTASGGDYAGENATVTVTVTDDDTTDLVVNRGSLTVDEDGGDGTFTVRLATQPTQQVSVTVSSADSGAVSVPSQPLTFTTQNWGTAQPVTVSGVSDDDAGDETVTVTVSASGGDYAGNTATVTVSVDDDDTTDLVVNRSSIEINEGGGGTFTVRLATQPTQQVSVSVSSADSGAVSVPSQPLTFTTQNWGTAQPVTVSGVSDDDAGDETVTVTLTASGGDYAGNTATVTVTVTDDDTTDLVVNRGSLSVDEGGGGTFTVRLATQPTQQVSVSVSSADSGAVSVPSQPLTFTTQNWRTAQTVTVSGVSDDDTGDETVTVTLTASGGDYAGNTATVTVTVDDDDTADLVVNRSSIEINEGGGGTFTVRLATQPTQQVSVSVSSGDSGAVSVPSQPLTFTTQNWRTAQPVTVSGVSDDDAGDETVTVTVSASGGDYAGNTATVTVTVDDDDTTDLVVNRGSLTVDEDGGGGTFTVRLATQPTQQVSVSVSSADSGAVSVPSQPLTFTTQNWRTAQTVRVSGVSDDDAGDETVTVTVSASGGDYAGENATVTVTVTDDDTTDLVVNRGSLTVDEDGGDGTFTVRLATQPTQQVSVSVSSADSGAVSVPSQPLTFTTQNWRTAQTVRVSGVSDDDAGDETVTVTVSASGGDYAGKNATVTVTVDDDDTTDLVVSRGSLTVDEDGDGTFTVRLATRPTQQVSVSVSSGDSGAVSVPSQPLTFTTQNWRTAQPVRVSGVSDDDAGDETVTVTVSASGGDYAGNTATVTVTVTDDDTTDLVVNRGSLTVDEDDDGTFTVRLATQPTQQVSVSVSSGDSGAVSVPSQPLTFTTQNWRTAQTVTVSGVSDDDAGDETVTVTVTASGGDYAGNTATVTVTVDDDDTTDLVVNRGSLTVDEGDGGGGTFTVRLATQPTQQVSVTVSSGDSGAVSVPSQPLTFTTQNWRTAQTVTVSGVSDDDAGDETVTVTVTASGGDYAGNTATVTVTVTDDDTTDLVVNRGSLTVDEGDGGGGTFTVRLATQPTQQVSVTVSSGDSGAVSVPSQPLTFTTQNWRIAQTVTVSGVSDDDAGDETVTVTVTASGGDYAGNTATVTVTVDDDDTTDLVVNRGSLTVDEDGGDGTFTVRLATRPTQQVSVSVSSGDSGAVSVPSQPLTFTTQNWRIAQPVTVSGVSDDDAGDETVTVTVTASGGDYAGENATVTVTVTDDDTTDLVVNRGSLTVDEDGGDGTFTVRLATQPTQQVSVTVSSGDSGAVSVPSQPLTFTTQNWGTAQPVTVSGVSDDDAGDETVTVTLTASGGDYAGENATVTVSVDDDDTTDLVVNRSSIEINEGGDGTFTVRLATQPTQQVSVSVSSGDSGAVSVPSQPLTFTTQNWGTAQPVTVSGVSDDDAGDETVTVTVSASGGDYAGETATVTVTVTDDDTTDLVVNRGSLTVDEGDGGGGTFTVRLATRPTQQVSVTVSSADSGAVSVPSQPLTFTTQNWGTAQPVTVSGVSDDDAGDETVTVTVTASGGDYAGETATVTVTVTDDDTTDLVVNRGSLTVDEDDDGTFTVRLATRPTQQVSVTVSSGDSGAVSVPSQPLTFTTQNWGTAQTVTVSGVSDDDAGDETVTVTVTASGGDYAGNTATVTVTVTDDDTTDLVVNRGSLTVDEDDDGTFTVRLATQPTQQVSVTVSSADSGAVSVPSQPLTFTTQNWRTAQTVTVSGVSDDDAGDETVTVTVTASGGDYAGNTATVTVTVDDDDTTDLVVNRGSLTVDEGDGGGGTFTVRLATQPTQQVSVTVSSGDSGAVSVPSQPLTFTTQNWGTAQPVTVSGVSDDDAGDETVTVTLTASGGDYAGETATVTVTVTDDDTTDLVVSRGSLTVDEGDGGGGTFTVRLATQPTQQVSVSVSSADSGAVSVPSQPLTFTTQNWRIAQTVTVSGVSDDDAGDETVTVTVTASGGDYAGENATVTVTVDDDDTTDLVVNRGSLTVDEDDDGTFTVRLATQPTQQVSVTVSSGDSGAVSVPSQPLTFTTQNWRIAQPVTVSGVSDDDTGDETVTVTVSASGGDYAGENATVTVTVDDDDTTDLVVSRSSIEINEDGDETFTVRLATQPTQQVSVSVSSADSGAVSVPSQPLTFTTQNWRAAQPVTVSGVSDDDAVDETVTVTLTASGGDYAGETATVTVTVDDDDTTDLVVNRGSLTVDEDGDGTFTVRLATRPTQQVSVTVSSADSGAVSVPSQPLTFTTQNWRAAQPVTVSGVSDDDAGDETVTVTLTASGGDYAGETATVTVTVDDDDTTDLVVNRGSLTVDEDGDDTFTVRLATRPTQQVSVTVSSADSGAVSVPSQPLTFTTQNWGAAQTVTVSGVSDDDAGDETVTVTLTASGGDYAGNTATVTVTVDDDETAGIRTRSSIEINEGDRVDFTVVLKVVPIEQVTIALSSSDPGAMSLSTPTMVFTTLDWSDPRTVLMTGVQDDDVSDEAVTLKLTVVSSGADYAGTEETVEVTILDDDRVPPSVPDSLEVIREERTQLNVEWAASTSVGSPVTGYTVSWREPDGSWTEATTSTPSASITGLSVGTEYEVQAKATNEFGDSEWSAPVTAYTDDCASGTTNPCSITVGNAATGRINVHDTVADRDWFAVWLMQGQMYRFEVKGREASDSGGTLADPELSVYTPSGTLVTGATNNDGGVGSNPLLLFTPDSTGGYHVEVGEHGGDEIGTYTVVAAIEMSPRFVGSTEMSLAENLQLSEQIDAVDDDADDSILEFQITGGADMDKFSITSQGLLEMTFTPNYEDPEDSDDDNTYEVEITVFSGPSTGISDGSASATFKVTILNSQDERPGKPQDLVVRHEDLNSISIHWDADPADTVPNSLYEVEVTAAGQEPYRVTGSSTTITVESLIQDEHYRFRVRAMNGDGFGGWAERISGYTDDCGHAVTDACLLAEGAQRTARINIKRDHGDADWFAVTATGRHQAFRIHAKGSEATDTGGTLRDPSFIVRNHLGQGLAAQTDDDSGAGLNAAHLFTTGHLDFTPSTFYIEVLRSQKDTSSILGTYTISALLDVRATVTSDTTVEVTEHSALMYRAVIEDPDAGDLVSDVRIASDDSDDSAFFAIDADYNITMTIEPDFERPQDANGNNVYDFALRYLNSTAFGSASWQIFQAMRVRVRDDDTEAPGVPRNGSIVSGLDSASVLWQSPNNLGPEVSRYQLRVADASASPLIWSATDLLAARPFNVWLNLSQGVEYVWQVRAGNDEGDGPWSPKAYFYLDECAGSPGADTCTIGSDSSKSGGINHTELTPDKDLYEISLISDQQYWIDVTGSAISDSVGALEDPYLRVLDSYGNRIVGADNNDGGSGLNARLLFEPSVSGTYYIEVSENGGDAVGLYVVAVELIDTQLRFVGNRALTLEEHADLSYQLMVVGQKIGHAITGYRITAGSDKGKFSVDSNGILSMTISPNFEDPQDANSDNHYQVEILVSSGPGGGQPDRQASAYFNVVIIDRTDEAPGVPRNGSIVSGLDSASVLWQSPNNLGPEVSRYQLRVADASASPLIWSATDLLAARPFNVWLNLSQGVEYVWQVRAGNDEGDGPWSPKAYFYLDECAGSPGADTCTIGSDSSKSGGINHTELTPDKDLYEISLISDQQYWIDVTGSAISDSVGALEDPYLRVLDSYGNRIVGADNNDGGSGLNARLLFEPSVSGTYYIEVSENGGDAVGLYVVAVELIDTQLRFVGNRALTLEEHADLSYQLMVVGQKIGHAITGYRITAGSDKGKFSVDSNGILSMTIEPDFEDPQDANSDNHYQVEILVSSGPGGGQPDRQASAYFNVVIIDRTDEAPGVPRNGSIVSGLDSASVLWQSPNNLGPEVSRYQLRVADASASPLIWSATDLLAARPFNVWLNLSQGVEYVWQVRAGNDEGDGPWSPKAYFYLDECAGSPGADTCTIGSDSSKSGGINHTELTPDKDLYEISLISDQQYWIDVTGSAISDSVGALEDPYLRVLDSYGNRIAGADNNDGGSGLNARLLFEPSVSGTYYIEVSENGGDAVGLYVVAVELIDTQLRFVGNRALTLEEHADLSYQLMVVGQKIGHAITGYAIVDRSDKGKFSVDSNGILSMTISPNFEDPQDANRDNHYQVEIQVSSGPGGGQPDRQASAYFNVVIIDRTDEAPGAPDPRVLSEERTELGVGWSEPLNDGPSINAYTVRIRQTSQGSFTELTLAANAMSHTWRDLNPATLYLVQVRAENNEGRGPWSQDLYPLTDDCSQSTTDACSLAVGVSDRGIINVDLTADKDWYEITLEADQLYRIGVEGHGIIQLGDPEVRVYDSSGSSIADAYDNDGGAGLDARLLFEPASDGTYYIEVGEHGGDGVGWYEVSVTEPPSRNPGTRSIFPEEHSEVDNIGDDDLRDDADSVRAGAIDLGEITGSGGLSNGVVRVSRSSINGVDQRSRLLSLYADRLHIH